MVSNITISKQRKNIIKYFTFILFILPTIEVSGITVVIDRFIPNPLGYNLLSFILSIPLIRSFKKKYGNMKSVVLAITFLVSYIAITFLLTINKTSLYETLTVFRYSYIQAVNLFILLPFMFSLNKEEVNYTLKLIFKILITFTLLYLSNNIIYDWMGVKDTLVENVGGASMDRSIIGLPLLDPIWMALLIVYTIMKVPKANKYLMLFLLTLIISFTRNILFSTFIIAFVVFTLSVYKNFKNFGRGIKIALIILMGIIVIAIAMPHAINFWIEKLLDTFNNELKNDIGTLAFRERLIDDALYSIRNNPMFGLGYIRDVAKGEYSMVMGSDTYIAPILWCEGWIGLALRVLPFILLGLKSIKNIIFKSKDYWLDIVIIACIVASLINYIQTKALTNYPLILGIILLLNIKNNYDRKTQDFGNYSIL